MQQKYLLKKMQWAGSKVLSFCSPGVDCWRYKRHNGVMNSSGVRALEGHNPLFTDCRSLRWGVLPRSGKPKAKSWSLLSMWEAKCFCKFPTKTGQEQMTRYCIVPTFDWFVLSAALTRPIAAPTARLCMTTIQFFFPPPVSTSTVSTPCNRQAPKLWTFQSRVLPGDNWMDWEVWTQRLFVSTHQIRHLLLCSPSTVQTKSLNHLSQFQWNIHV